MRDLTLINDGDGLEPAMGMFTHPARARGRRKFRRRRIVEQQETD